MAKTERATTPEARLREMEREFLDRSAVFGTAVGGLFRIAQGVENPQAAAEHTLRLMGCDALAQLASASPTPEAPHE